MHTFSTRPHHFYQTMCIIAQKFALFRLKHTAHCTSEAKDTVYFTYMYMTAISFLYSMVFLLHGPLYHTVSKYLYSGDTWKPKEAKMHNVRRRSHHYDKDPQKRACAVRFATRSDLRVCAKWLLTKYQKNSLQDCCRNPPLLSAVTWESSQGLSARAKRFRWSLKDDQTHQLRV